MLYSFQTWFAGAALADTLIALAMTFLLTRNTSGFQGGDILRRIVRLTIETNTVTGKSFSGIFHPQRLTVAISCCGHRRFRIFCRPPDDQYLHGSVSRSTNSKYRSSSDSISSDHTPLGNCTPTP